MLCVPVSEMKKELDQEENPFVELAALNSPLSSLTSTAFIPLPPLSPAVPVTVILPVEAVEPFCGSEILTVGFVPSAAYAS
jgi:hypothetical protein